MDLIGQNYLKNCGIFTIRDLISYYPRDYEDRSKPRNIEDLNDGEYGLIKGICVSKLNNINLRNGKSIQKLVVRDKTSDCVITWFNQPYLKNVFKS